VTPNSLVPSYGVIDYVSAYGAHKATIPTLQWTLGGDYGEYIAHDDVTVVDAETMWLDFIADLVPFALATTTFNSVTMYNKPTIDAPSVPVAILPVGEVGTSVATSQAKATQSTWNFRTTLFGHMKLVLLDIPVGGGFEKTLPAIWGAPDLAILGALSDLSKAFCGRDNAAIASGISKTYTMNEKLRRAYGMA